MQKTMVTLLVLGLIGLFAGATLASPSAKDNAKALVRNAVAYVKYQGVTKTIAEINKPGGIFDRGETYVFAYDLQGVMVAHPKNPALIGKKLLDVPDTQGKLFRKEIVEKALSKGSGWVDYVYLNPETNEMEHKTTYFQKAGDIILCCGVYKDYSHEGD